MSNPVPPPSALREFATPRLHDEAFACLEQLYPRGAGSVLDLGAGTGAWSDRLLRHGYRGVEALDLNPLEFKGVAQFVPGDLNQDFSRQLPGKKYDLITALEVIEHLENPTHFLRQCAGLLAPGGTLVITTPNIESMPGRLKFLLSGRLRHFDGQGDKTHIAPIDPFLLARLAARAGLAVSERRPLVRYWYDRRPLFLALAGLLAPFAGGTPYGACHLFVLRRTGNA